MPSLGEKYQWRIIAAVSGVSALLAVLATLLGIGYLRQKDLQQAARRETIRANEASAGARSAANRRLRARDQAEELVEFLLDNLREELFQLNRSDLIGAAAEKAVAYFDQLPPDLITSESKARHASVLLTLSDARYQQGDDTGAIAAANRSIAIWRQLAAGVDPEGDYFVRLGRALGELGLYQNQSDDPYAADRTYREMIRHYENPPAMLKNDGWRDHGLAKAHLGLGEIERLKKNYGEARKEYSSSLTHIAAALKHNPEELSWLQMLMTLHNNSGVTFMHDKNYPAAEKSFVRAAEPNRALMRLEPKNRRWTKELATTLLNLGSLLQLKKDYAQALPYVTEALALRQAAADWDPKSTRALRKLAHARYRMASIQFDIGNNSNALANARGSLDAVRRLILADPEDPEAIKVMENDIARYVDRLVDAGQPGDARELLQETAAFARANRTEDSASFAWDKLLASLSVNSIRLDKIKNDSAKQDGIQIAD